MSEEFNDSSLGSELAAARNKAGLSIDDLQKKTKIQKKYLVAIENNDFDALPGDFYVRAFVRQVAGVVGLDGEALINKYLSNNDTTENTSSEGTEDNQAKNEESSQKRAARVVKTPRQHRNVFSGISNGRRYLPIISLVVIIVAVIVIIGFAITSTQKDSSSATPTDSKVTVSNDDSAKKKINHKNNNQKKLKDGQTEIKPVKGSTTDFTVRTGNTESKLDLAATQKSTDMVKVDGKVIYQGVVTRAAGHMVQIPKNAKEVNLTMSNAPVSIVKFNGKQVTLAAPAKGENAMQRIMNFKFIK